MANEITFGFETGKSLTAKVYAPDGTRREDPDITLTEIGSTGLYTGTASSILTGDLVIIDDGTYQVGYGQYRPTVDQTAIDAILVDTGTTLDGKIDTIDTNVDAVLVDTGTGGVLVATAAKTGYKLASDGLDSVSTTEPDGVASNFREIVVQLWRRFFGKSTLSGSQLLTYKSDGTTVATTQTVSETSTVQSSGEAS